MLMTTVDGEVELVPLRTGFDMVWRGYDRGQVKEFVRQTEAEAHLVAADRDAAVTRVEELARQLEELRSDNHRLRAKLDRVCRTPIEPDALTERLRRMLELARDEAAEITARAQAASEEIWASAEEAGARLRERYERLIAELDVRRREMETEHHELISRTRAEVDAMTSQAEQRRRQLDEQAALRRQEVESDFEIAMAARRGEAMRTMAERRTTAETEAQRMLDEAGAQARHMIAEARWEVAALREVRDRITAQLDDTSHLLAEALPRLRPQPGEPAGPPGEDTPPVPAQRDHATERAKPARRRGSSAGTRDVAMSRTPAT
jgi:cell division septum initiation protein DivIVA